MSRADAERLLSVLAARLAHRLASATTDADRTDAEAALRRFNDGLPDAIRRLEAA